MKKDGFYENAIKFARKGIFLSISMCAMTMMASQYLEVNVQKTTDILSPQTYVHSVNCVEDGIKVKMNFPLDRGKTVDEIGVKAQSSNSDKIPQTYSVAKDMVEKGIYSVVIPYDDFEDDKYTFTSYCKIKGDNSFVWGDSKSINLNKGTTPDIELLYKDFESGVLTLQIGIDSTAQSDIRNVKLVYSTDKNLFRKKMSFFEVEDPQNIKIEEEDVSNYGENIYETYIDIPSDAEYAWFRIEAFNDVGKAKSDTYTVQNGRIDTAERFYAIKTWIITWSPYFPHIFGGSSILGIIISLLIKIRKHISKEISGE